MPELIVCVQDKFEQYEGFALRQICTCACPCVKLTHESQDIILAPKFIGLQSNHVQSETEALISSSLRFDAV